MGDRAIDIFHGAQHALAEVARLIAVAQFEGFVLAGGCARGHRGAAARAVFENDVRFDGGIAARIEDLPADARARFLSPCRLLRTNQPAHYHCLDLALDVTLRDARENCEVAF